MEQINFSSGTGAPMSGSIWFPALKLEYLQRTGSFWQEQTEGQKSNFSIYA